MLKMTVGNLSPQAREPELRALFAVHGTVRCLKMAANLFTGACLGVVCVEMDDAEAHAAITALNGSKFLGQTLKVREQPSRPPRQPEQSSH